MAQKSLYFTGLTEDSRRVLYRLEAENTAPTLIDINSPELAWEFEGNLYFSAVDEETGVGLYRIEAGSDTPILVAEGLSHQFEVAEVKGDLYFSASTETGIELFRIEAGATTPTLIDISPDET